MRGEARKTIHILHPPGDKSALWRFCVRELEAERVVFRRAVVAGQGGQGGQVKRGGKEGGVVFGAAHCFVVFGDAGRAREGGGRVMERWPGCVVDFARQEWVEREEGAGGEGKASRVIHVVGGGALTREEIEGIVRGFEGFEELQFNPFHSRVSFKDVEFATMALKELARTTGFPVSYSNNTLERERDRVDGSSAGEGPTEDQDGNGGGEGKARVGKGGGRQRRGGEESGSGAEKKLTRKMKRETGGGGVGGGGEEEEVEADVKGEGGGSLEEAESFDLSVS
ncbi:hypothetical protein HDU67_005315 [Dinochytrium kinnereticum]|nr:hypothetical protein HDU67_005315 [Dinochytrium kinnereticum]